MIQKEIIKLIEEFNVIIIHHHINPDPDCIGSMLGLKYILQASYPNKKVFAVGELNEHTKFLGILDEVEDETYHEALVIMVDVGDKSRVVDDRFLTGKKLIKIDHHPLTITIADLEWVDTSYAACTEMIIDLYVQNKDKLVMNEEAARALYAGLLTDTGRFYYSSVTERTLRYGSEVYRFNFSKSDLYANLYHASVEELKFKGFIISEFKYTENGLGYLKIDSNVLAQFDITPEFASTMVNTLSNIAEIITWIFFVEYADKGSIRVEFRSRGPHVNGLAKKYGGGGHAYASGALVTRWEDVELIIHDADELCKNFKMV